MEWPLFRIVILYFQVSLVWALLPYVACQSGIAANGSTYSLALLGLDIEENPEITYTLVMTNPGSDDVIVTIEDLSRGIVDTVTVAVGEVETRDLAQPQSMNGSEIANKTVHVYSSSPFNLQVFSEKGEYVEGFLAILRESLYGSRGISNTYEYITTTFCAISGFCQIAISAFEDNSGVSVEFPATTEEVVLCKGMGYYRSHRDKLIYLNKFDSIQFESASDLSGVRIYSFQPIAVFVGSRNVTQGDKEVHMIEQLNPSSQWGTKFALKALGENGYGDLVKISVHYENTTIDMKGFPLFKVTHYSHNVWRRLDKGMDTFIQASRPIQVVQITGLTFATEGEETAAAMTVVPAIQHGQRSFNISCGKNEAAEFHIVSDFDLDGGFNEDYCYQDKNDAIIGKPTDPICLEILKPMNQCWEICQVDCSWMTALDTYNHMTEEEKTAMHEAMAAQQKKELSVDQTTLSAKTAQKESAEDERASAASIGYVGIALFAIVFGTIFIMDINAVIRDVMITGRNIREGFERLRDFVKRRRTTTTS